MDNNEAWRNRETAMSHYRQEMADLQSELAASQERERALIDNVLSIRHWKSYDSVLQVKDLRWFKEIESQASAEPMPLVPFWECDKCGNVATIEREILCWKCGKGEMIYREASQASAEVNK